MTFKEREYQRELDHLVCEEWRHGARDVMPVLPCGGGKCLARGTPVLLADGTVLPVEQIEVGMRLASPTGRPNTVQALGRGRERMYRVTPTKGEPYVVNASHILSLRKAQGSDAFVLANGVRISQDQDIVNVEVEVLARSNKTAKHCLKGWRAPVHHFEGETSLLPMPAYILGIWLGDGSTGLPALTKPAGVVVDAWRAYGQSMGLACREETSKGTRCATWYLTNGVKGSPNPITGILRYLGICQAKRIPRKYLIAPWRERMELLAGLLDTDGSQSKAGYDWITSNRDLANDFAFLARSLGFACYINECRKSIASTDFEGTYWRCYVSGDCNQIPCRAKPSPARRQIKRHLVHGITLTELPEDDYFGFELDGDRLFMLGDFTVTHNTVIFCNMLAREKGASVIIVHRNHLVGQASKTLALNGVRHRVLGSLETQRTCVQLHMNDPLIGKNFVDPTAPCAVAGVDTLVRMDPKDPWFARVTLVITDEGHHLQAENKWGKARLMFPNARGAAFTATAMRPDGRGLGRHSHGLIDSMVQVIGMRDLINMGYLADYKIYAPPNTLDLSGISITASGELNLDATAKAVHKAHITGDIVQTYVSRAMGRLGATFAVDVAAARELTEAYRAAGVPAEMITGDTHETTRDSIFRRYRARQVLQLVSVDVLGEGTDVPAMEVISMGRPTASWVTYVQQFCRPLRPLGDKEGVIFDHVGNVERHARTRGLPDTPQRYTLEPRESASKGTPSDAEPVRVCPSCSGTYLIIDHGNVCPYCSTEREPAGRSTPAQVDGVLRELDPEVLRLLRRVADEVMGPAPQFSNPAIAKAAHRNHVEKQTAQNELRAALATWGAWQVEGKGRTEEQAQRKFFVRYGIDPLSAAALGPADARELAGKVLAELAAHGYNIDGSVN